MMERKYFVLAALVTVGMIFFVATPFVQAGGWQKWNRLEGSSLRSIVDPETGLAGNSPHSLIVLAPKGPFARRAALRGNFIDVDPTIIPPGGSVTDFIGEVVMTGPSTYKATAYAYIMVPDPTSTPQAPKRDLVFAIIVGMSEGEFLDQDLVEGTQVASVYFGPGAPAIGLPVPNQDEDGDLIPDPGQPPLGGTIGPDVYVDKRTPMVP